MAGIVAALDNAQDVVGVAPGATPVAVKVLDQDGYGLDSEVVAGLEWVLNNNNDGDSNNDIDVVNMSLGAALSDFNPVPASCDDTIYGPAISSLTAAGYSLRLILKWLRTLLRQILEAVLVALSSPTITNPAS